MAKGHIYLCSNATEDECLQRMLFGGTEKYKSEVSLAQIGDPLFLYNYISKRLHGKFKAVSENQLNIEPDAWLGKFPWQIRVAWEQEYQPISKADFENVVPFRTDFPLANISESQVEELEKIFRSTQRLPAEENDFRNKFPATHVTDDGHRVRSLGEVTIDNWLYKQEIVHGYERKIPIEENMFCDFIIPIPGKKDCVYVEYWGLEDDAYLDRKQHKIDLYKKYNLNLIELTRHSLEAIDDNMPLKLRPYFSEHKFF